MISKPWLPAQGSGRGYRSGRGELALLSSVELGSFLEKSRSDVSDPVAQARLCSTHLCSDQIRVEARGLGFQDSALSPCSLPLPGLETGHCCEDRRERALGCGRLPRANCPAGAREGGPGPGQRDQGWHPEWEGYSPGSPDASGFYLSFSNLQGAKRPVSRGREGRAAGVCGGALSCPLWAGPGPAHRPLALGFRRGSSAEGKPGSILPPLPGGSSRPPRRPRRSPPGRSPSSRPRPPAPQR